VGEILTIRNFGPIKNMTLDLRHVNILIGDQGTGKSTVAKVLIAVQSIVQASIAELAIGPGDDFTKINRLLLGTFKVLEIENYLQENTIIEFQNNYFRFLYDKLNQKANVKIDSEVQTNLFFDFDFNYIPAERSLVNTLSKSLYVLIEAGTSLPKLFTRFGTKYLKTREAKLFFDYSAVTGIKYAFSNSKGDTIILENGNEIPISEASTGVQVSTPLLIVLDAVTNKSREDKYEKALPPVLLVVEEPELNLFPETQEKLCRYLINSVLIRENSKTKYTNQLLITTHSPYILTSINNLMYAFVAGKSDAAATGKVIEQKYWLNPDDVSAYILKDGICEDIFDRKEALIDAARIDEVSQVLNKQFDDLINIELSVTDEKHS
jgi:predicted ATP-dependent endonuclease of OLD family